MSLCERSCQPAFDEATWELAGRRRREEKIQLGLQSGLFLPTCLFMAEIFCLLHPRCLRQSLHDVSNMLFILVGMEWRHNGR